MVKANEPISFFGDLSVSCKCLGHHAVITFFVRFPALHCIPHLVNGALRQRVVGQSGKSPSVFGLRWSCALGLHTANKSCHKVFGTSLTRFPYHLPPFVNPIPFGHHATQISLVVPLSLHCTTFAHLCDAQSKRRNTHTHTHRCHMKCALSERGLPPGLPGGRPAQPGVPPLLRRRECPRGTASSAWRHTRRRHVSLRKLCVKTRLTHRE